MPAADDVNVNIDEDGLPVGAMSDQYVAGMIRQTVSILKSHDQDAYDILGPILQKIANSHRYLVMACLSYKHHADQTNEIVDAAIELHQADYEWQRGAKWDDGKENKYLHLLQVMDRYRGIVSREPEQDDYE